MHEEIAQLKKEVEKLRLRNRRVEADKAWEMSTFRVLLLTGITYLLAALVMDGIGVVKPFLSATVPALGYFLSVQTIPILKKAWIRRYIKSLEDSPVMDIPGMFPAGTRVATFAIGPTGEAEEAFARIPGVLGTSPGYTHPATVRNRTEIIRVFFNPKKVSYGYLLNTFWEIHDPTEDGGHEYPSTIFYHTDSQRQNAEDSLIQQESLLDPDIAIITVIEPATDVYE